MVDGSIKPYQYLNMKPVPVIASFSDDGRIMPLYVKIDGERYKVASSWSEKMFRSQALFHCKIEDHGVYKMVNLTYFFDDCLWGL